MTEPQQHCENSLLKSEPEYAGFWMRFLAYCIDILVLQISMQIVLQIITWVLWLLPNVRETIFKIATEWVNLPHNQVALFNFTVFVLIVSAIVGCLINAFMCWPYYALMESSEWQATLGKRLCGLKVTSFEGERLTFGRASGRYFGKFLSTLTCCVGYIMAAFTEKKQALHDIIAGTLVVKAN